MSGAVSILTKMRASKEALGLIAASSLFVASHAALSSYSIILQTSSKTRAAETFQLYSSPSSAPPEFSLTDLNIVVPSGTTVTDWFNVSFSPFRGQDGAVLHEYTEATMNGPPFTLRVIESPDFSPIAKYQNVDQVDQDLVMLQDDKMLVDSITANALLASVYGRENLFSGLYPRYIKNVSGSASVEAATGGRYSDGIVYKMRGGDGQGLPFQLLKGRVFVVNNMFQAIQDYTQWMKAEEDFEQAFNSSECGNIPTLADLSTAYELVNKYPFCDDISFQYFTQGVRENLHKVNQAWVRECPALAKFRRIPGSGGPPEDKTVCLQGLNCLLGYKPWEYPLFTRNGALGFGKNVTTGDRVAAEVSDPEAAGVCNLAP
jgi:hypothetical protein